MSECVVKMKKPLVCITKDGYHGNCPMDRVWCIQRNAPKGITMGEAYAAMTDKVPSWCPVVCQLPEGHGRLIDEAVFCENVVQYSHQSTKTIGRCDTDHYRHDTDCCRKEQNMSVDTKDYPAYQEGYEAGKRDAAPDGVTSIAPRKEDDVGAGMTDYSKTVKALRECARADADCHNNCPYYNHDTCTDDLKSDAADAIEELQAQLPKRGKWIKDEEQSQKHVEAIYTCSACHNFDAWGVTELYPYCPNCGAKMEARDNEV